MTETKYTKAEMDYLIDILENKNTGWVYEYVGDPREQGYMPKELWDIVDRHIEREYNMPIEEFRKPYENSKPGEISF